MGTLAITISSFFTSNVTTTKTAEATETKPADQIAIVTEVPTPTSTEIKSVEQKPLLAESTEPAETQEQTKPKQVTAHSKMSDVFSVPFYSQLTDISSPSWKKIGCGIASLAMLIEFYEPGSVDVDTLLQEGIEANAYLDSAGWTYAGLIGVSKKYGLTGRSYDLGSASMTTAFTALTEALEDGPVMVSVHYTFQPTNPIPHLVIANGVRDGKFYYNDPAAPSGDRSISVTQFKSAWKKRYIEIRPVL